MTEVGNGTVVVGLAEDAKLARASLRYAAEEANRRGTDVLLVHACTRSWSVGTIEPVLPLEKQVKQGARIVRAGAKYLSPLLSSGLRVRRHVSPATAVDLLIELSDTAALIVVQRRHISALRHVSTGSTSSVVAARAGCPVAVVRRDQDMAENSGVLVGVDVAGPAGTALPVAFEEAQLRKSDLTAVYIWSAETALTGYGWDPSSPERLERWRERARLRLAEVVAGYAEQFPGVVVRQRVLDGPVVSRLLQASREADLLVVGRHGKSHLGSFALGGVARSCMAEASCPVVVTPTMQPPKRESPTIRQVSSSTP